MSEVTPAVEVRDLRVHFPVRKRGKPSLIKAVDGVSLSVSPGSTLGIVGESGSGKSTLGRAILRLVEPTSGEVWLGGVNISALKPSELRSVRRRAQMVFQDPLASVNPRMSVGETLTEPLLVHGPLAGETVEERVIRMARRVGLNPEWLDRFPHEFSGGQLQRIGVARALMVNPDLVILDEAVSALDVSIQAQIINLLMDLQAELGLTFLFVSHDLSVVRHVASRVAVMYLGRVVEVGETDELFARPGHPYTAALLSAVPVPDPRRRDSRRRLVLEGDLGPASTAEEGCPFAPRCWLRSQLGNPEACTSTVPDPQGPRQIACHFPDQEALTE